MSVAISTLSADAQATLSFMTGISGTGTVIVQNSGWSWDPEVTGSTVYDASAWPHKWGGGAAGTPATVTYAFDASSDFTVGEQAIISGALALWSAESGISFTEAASPTAAQLAFYRGGAPDDPGSQSGVYTNYTAPNGQFGAATIPATSSVYVSFDTSVNYWSELDSFTAFGGYGVDTVVHELGHVLGLFHTGPYNGAVDPLTQQFNSTDSRQWSIMSYIYPWEPAAYSSEYVYKNSDWGASPDGFARAPTTPMPLDILAAQRLYGLPTSTPLDGGQVFGFHCNIAGLIEPFFDFTVNTAPVVTLWDEGTGNALDLSGFAGAATVDLQPGTFSSADGMTDNIGIAYGTRIDRLVGAQGGGVVVLNGDSDTVQATGGSNEAVVAAADGLYTAGAAGAGATTVLSATGVVDLLQGVQGLGFSGGGDTVVGSNAGAGVATFDLSGGGNLLFVGSQLTSVTSAGGDTVVGGAGGTAVSVTGSVGSLIYGGAGVLLVNGGDGVSTVVSGADGGRIGGGSGGAVVWAAGPVTYIGGSGAATVAADRSSSATVRGGAGGGVFIGGGAGGNVLGASGGSATMLGGGTGDQLVAENSADNVLAAGAGAETLYAVGATGRNVFFAGADTVAMTGGSGANVFVAGSGEATVNPGVGGALLACIDGEAGGEIVAIGWNPAQDEVALYGYAPNAIAKAVAGAKVDAGGSTVVTLADHTRILFADVTGISKSWFV
jgi:Ca2+-binding RTX toxin-like protein